MRRRHVAVGIVCALVVGLLGPAVPSALGAVRARRSSEGSSHGLGDGSPRLLRRGVRGRADLKAAAATKGWAARGRAVHRTLTGVAARSQARAKAVVRATTGVRAESFWLTNVLVVTDGATPALAGASPASPA